MKELFLEYGDFLVAAMLAFGVISGLGWVLEQILIGNFVY